MKKIIVIVLFLLATSLYAQTEWQGIRFSQPQLDGWTLGHMAKGGLTYTGFRLIKTPKPVALGLVLFGALAYELVYDGLGVMKDSDPSGADLVGDVTADCIGGVIACGIEILLRLDKRLDKISVGMNKNEIRLCIGF